MGFLHECPSCHKVCEQNICTRTDAKGYETELLECSGCKHTWFATHVITEVNQLQEKAHLFSREQLDKLTRAIDAQERLHKNMMDLVKHHKKYPPKRTDAWLVIPDILYEDIVGIIGEFMTMFPDFDPDKYESTDEQGEHTIKTLTEEDNG